MNPLDHPRYGEAFLRELNAGIERSRPLIHTTQETNVTPAEDPNTQDNTATAATAQQPTSDTAQTSAPSLAGAGSAPPPKPAIGRIVHYRKGVQAPLPATIVRVREGGTLDLAVFTGAEPPVVTRMEVRKTDPNDSGTGWFWPPKV